MSDLTTYMSANAHHQEYLQFLLNKIEVLEWDNVSVLDFLRQSYPDQVAEVSDRTPEEYDNYVKTHLIPLMQQYKSNTIDYRTLSQRLKAIYQGYEDYRNTDEPMTSDGLFGRLFPPKSSEKAPIITTPSHVVPVKQVLDDARHLNQTGDSGTYTTQQLATLKGVQEWACDQLNRSSLLRSVMLKEGTQMNPQPSQGYSRNRCLDPDEVEADVEKEKEMSPANLMRPLLPTTHQPMSPSQYRSMILSTTTTTTTTNDQHKPIEGESTKAPIPNDCTDRPGVMMVVNPPHDISSSRLPRMPMTTQGTSKPNRDDGNNNYENDRDDDDDDPVTVYNWSIDRSKGHRMSLNHFAKNDAIEAMGRKRCHQSVPVGC